MKRPLAVAVAVLALGNALAMASTPHPNSLLSHLLASTASAQSPDQLAGSGASPSSQFPNQRPLNDPWVNQLRDAAVQVWQKRGVTIPTVPLDVADNLTLNGQGSHDPAGSLINEGRPDARLVLDGHWLGIELARARSTRRTTFDKREALAQIALGLLHEIGHTGGLPHVQGPGLMSADGPWGTRAPVEELGLIHQLIPRSSTVRQRSRGGAVFGSGTG